MSARDRRNQINADNMFNSFADESPKVSVADADAKLYGELSKIDSQLVKVDQNGNMRLGNFSLNSTGLVLHGKVEREEWEYVGSIIKRLGDSIQWLIGDWILYGVDFKWGETYKEIAERTGYNVETVHNITAVCKKIELPRRHGNLSFGHHQAVVGKSPEEQDQWLKDASSGNWTVSEMRDAMKGDPPPPPLDITGDKRFDKAHSNILSRYHRSKPDMQLKMISALEALLDSMRRDMKRG